MGQYYKPINVDKKEHVYSHDYDSGLKLMEHSWKDNKFVAVVANLIAHGGAWCGNRIVWAGDYARPEQGTDENLFCLIEDKPEKIHAIGEPDPLRYLINLDTKEYVDIDKVPPTEGYGGEEWFIHPLPLLTAEGNGAGGGDFRGNDPNGLVGRWARAHLTIQADKPKKDYTELVFDLVED